MDFEFSHDIGAMRLRGLRADPERARHLLAAPAFTKQLNDFPLSFAKTLADCEINNIAPDVSSAFCYNS